MFYYASRQAGPNYSQTSVAAWPVAQNSRALETRIFDLKAALVTTARNGGHCAPRHRPRGGASPTVGAGRSVRSGAGSRAMHSLTQEIRSFSRANLRKQRTRVTTLTGRRIIETWRGACFHMEEEEEAAPGGGFVQDLSADLQVGVVKPWLLLGEWGWGRRARRGGAVRRPGRGSAQQRARSLSLRRVAGCCS